MNGSSDSIQNSMTELILILFVLAILAMLMLSNTLRAKLAELSLVNQKLANAEILVADHDEQETYKDDAILLQLELEAKIKELHHVNEQVVELQESLETNTVALEIANKRTAKLEQKNADLRETLEMKTQALDKTNKLIDDLEQKLPDVEAINQMEEEISELQELLDIKTEALGIANDQIVDLKQQLESTTKELLSANNIIKQGINDLQEALFLTSYIQLQVQRIKTIVVTKERNIEDIDANSNSEVKTKEITSLNQGFADTLSQLDDALKSVRDTEVELRKHLIAQACSDNDSLSVPKILTTVTIIGPNIFEVELGNDVIKLDIEGIRNKFQAQIETAKTNNCFLLIQVKSGTNEYETYNKGFKLLTRIFYTHNID